MIDWRISASAILCILLSVFLAHRLKLRRENIKSYTQAITDFKNLMIPFIKSLEDANANPSILVVQCYSEQDEAEARVIALVEDMVEFKPMKVNRNNYVFEVDGYRISVGPSYRDNSISFRIYQMIEGKDLRLVKIGPAKEVFDYFPERFAQAMLFQLDLLH